MVLHDDKERTLFSAFKHVTYFLKHFHVVGYKPELETENDREPRPLAESNVFSSEIAGTGGRRHTLAIDLDVPAVLLPSSTPGHSHLYIDVEMSWHQYAAILNALADAKILEEGYVLASIARKHTALRLPWERKRNAGEIVVLHDNN